MSYPPPNQNYPGGGNPNYNQTQQPGTFGPPNGQGQGGLPSGAGYGQQQQQQSYGGPPGQGPPGNNGYSAPPPVTYSQQSSTYNQNNPVSNYQSNQTGPPMGAGPPSSMGHGPPNSMVQPPATNKATFFSTASGAPVPSGSTTSGPPSSGAGLGMGGMPAPPGYQGN